MLQLIDYLHCTVDVDVLIDKHSLSVSCKHNYVSNYKEASSQNTTKLKCFCNLTNQAENNSFSFSNKFCISFACSLVVFAQN